jgi:8-oxo-dGTP pyrophosphatase MutT (NUDIX family)
MMFDTLSSLKERLQLMAAFDHPYPFRPAGDGRPAAVLILCAKSEKDGSRPSGFRILMTRRTDSVETHKGQYALPGGMSDPEDGDPALQETLIQTALRETEEEMGIAREKVSSAGILPSIWTPTGFRVTPVMGVLNEPLESIEIVPSEKEIAYWFWPEFDRLRDPGVHSLETREVEYRGKHFEVPIDVFQYDEHRIWGATGAILKNFIGRWEKLG